MQRRTFLALPLVSLPVVALAHHGWSSFDQTRPLYLAGKSKNVQWRNPHVELDLQLDTPLALPKDFANYPTPPQSANVDGAALLKTAQLPKRTDRSWHIELAPLTRMGAWQVPEIKDGDALAVLGFTFAREEGEPILRAEYLFLGGKTYGLRSAPI
jgi:hypothetical protein